MTKNSKNWGDALLFAIFSTHAFSVCAFSNFICRRTTRRFDALKVYMAFQARGKDGFGTIIDTAVENAAYLYERVSSDGDFIAPVKPEMSSVVFALNGSDELNKSVRRRLLAEGTIIGQTVKDGRVMLKFTLLNPNLTHEKIDAIIDRIKEIGTESDSAL